MVIVLIPAYDEARALGDLLPLLPARLHGRAVQVLVVSDGSTDDTAAVARAAGADVIELRANGGKTAAVRAGLAAVATRAFECVVLMDGDGQHDPSDLHALTAPVVSGELDVACGSRWMGQRGRGHAPLNRYLVRRAVVAVLRRRLGATVTDPFCGYRALSHRAATSWQPSGDQYEAELELLFDAAMRGWNAAEVPVARIYTGDCSKMRATGGRLRVMRQYAQTIAWKSDELAAHTEPRPGFPDLRSLRAGDRTAGGAARRAP